MKRIRVRAILAGMVLCVVSTVSRADLAPYSQEFEGLAQADPAALSNDGWKVFGNVFGPDWSYWYGYGPFPAPNGGPAFSAIDVGQGDPPQGNQQLVVYNDYNNGNHGDGSNANIEANVFQEQIIGAADVGSTWIFEFDAKRGNLAGTSTAEAFFKTLNPAAGYALTNYIPVNLTAIPNAWGHYALSIYIDPSLEGQLLQFGFLNRASNYQPSGIFYDNVTLARAPQLAPYTQNFEGLVQSDPAALGNDGWKVFGNVFGPDGSYWYGYGPFPAPNGGPGFCAIDVGQGGPPQGDQQLVVYNDYNNGNHGDGSSAVIEANVFQEQIINAADVGRTFLFEFDAKRGNLAGASTAGAFFKTLNPAAGYALTNFILVDLTAIPNAWGHYALSIYIDPSLAGQILQFGFINRASNYQGSGIFYDNIAFGPGTPCVSGDSCNDGNACTADSCDPTSLLCQHVALGSDTSCDDGDACTTVDTCGGLTCNGGTPVVCTASDQCHVAGICDPGTGFCSNPNAPNGTTCNDGDTGTDPDTCQVGICVGTPLCSIQPKPKSAGYYKKLCKGGAPRPSHSDALTDADAVCVGQLTTTFAGITTATQICQEYLKPAGEQDPDGPECKDCQKAEDELLGLALNICRERVCESQEVDSGCGSGHDSHNRVLTTVAASLATSDATLSDPARNKTTCKQASCLAKEINNGKGIHHVSLSIAKAPANGMRLTWENPVMDDGSGNGTSYSIWRRALNANELFVKLAETTDLIWVDVNSGTTSWEYEVTFTVEP